MAESSKLSIAGMTCEGCVKSVTKALCAVPGVTRVDVSLDRGEAVILHDPAQAPLSKLRTAVEDAGFDVG